MGVFDTIYGKVLCPHCNKINKFDFQIKKPDSSFQLLTIGDYINKDEDEDEYIILLEKNWICTKCKEIFDINVVLVNGQIIKYLNNIEYKNININNETNIEEGFGKNQEYLEQCTKGIGYAREKFLIENHPKKIGDRINVLNQEWLIIEVFKEKLIEDKTNKAYNFIKSTHRDSYIYKVTNKLGNRYIRLILNFNKGYYVFLDNGVKKEYDSKNPNDFVLQPLCILEKIERRM